jgi:mono/diheme cytochrome c family protein
MTSPIGRLALCIVALLGPDLASAARSTNSIDWIRQDHQDQIRRLNRQLAVFKENKGVHNYYLEAVVPTAYHASALVLPGDQDAAQIMFRRTRALLDELRSMDSEASAALESDLTALKARLDASAPHVFPYTAREVVQQVKPAGRVPVGAGARNTTADTIDIDRIPDLTDDNATMGLNLAAADSSPLIQKKSGPAPKAAAAGPVCPPAKQAAPAVKKEDNTPKMDVLVEEPKVVVRSDRQEPVVDPSHPRVVLAMDILALQRRIALANPLLGKGALLVCTRTLAEPHIAAQYKRTPGDERSGIFRLAGHLGDAPEFTEILSDAAVANGRLAGQPLSAAARAANGLKPGAFGWPDLRFDGKQIVFAWKEHESCNHGAEDTRTYYTGTGESQYSRERCYHIYTLDLDSSAPDRLRMLTDGSGNDGHPVYLPNGRIVFISDRRGGVERCGGPSRATLLHSMNPDGSDQINISTHETSEFSPNVNGDGRLMYGRWDYVDRGDCIAHHIWTSYPDGRDPRAPHGNYFMGKFRPDAETEFQPIPGDHRLVALAAAHHVLGHRGSVIVLDLDQPDDDGMSQVRRFTPNIAFPETREGDTGQQAGPLACPWPLSRNFVLAGSDAGPVLIDAFGNRTLLAKVDSGAPTFEVIPARPRARPPVIPHLAATGVPAGQKNAEPPPSTGVFNLMNVYNSLLPWPDGVEIAEIRIVRIFPRANTIWMNWPDVGVASESLVRGVVGTVPVEADGSARFEVPANTLVYFQALDSKGRAVQTMRSGTYLQPGAQVSCQGCHEPKHQAPPKPKQIPLALRRAPSVPKAGPAGSDPVFYPALVQPVLDRRCVACHTKEISRGKNVPDLSPTPVLKSGGNEDLLYTRTGPPTRWTVSYDNLARYTGRNFGGRPVKYEGRTTPGSFGTINSRLYPLLAEGKHHGVKLETEEMMRLAIWMDLNSNFLGHYLFTEEQSCGVLPAPPPPSYPDTSDHPEARVLIAEYRAGAGAAVTPAPAAAGPKATAPAPRKNPRIPDLDTPPAEPDVLSPL